MNSNENISNSNYRSDRIETKSSSHTSSSSSKHRHRDDHRDDSSDEYHSYKRSKSRSRSRSHSRSRESSSYLSRTHASHAFTNNESDYYKVMNLQIIIYKKKQMH
jgi:hypothetical protein